MFNLIFSIGLIQFEKNRPEFCRGDMRTKTYFLGFECLFFVRVNPLKMGRPIHYHQPTVAHIHGLYIDVMLLLASKMSSF